MNLVAMRPRHHRVAVQAGFGAVLVHVGSQSSPSLPPARAEILRDTVPHSLFNSTPSSAAAPRTLTHTSNSSSSRSKSSRMQKRLRERESESGLRARLSCPLPPPPSLHLLSVGRTDGLVVSGKATRAPLRKQQPAAAAAAPLPALLARMCANT